jgi:hypothetical protein
MGGHEPHVDRGEFDVDRSKLDVDRSKHDVDWREHDVDWREHDAANHQWRSVDLGKRSAAGAVRQ